MDWVGSGWRVFFNPTRPCGVEKFLIHHKQKLTQPNPHRSGCGLGWVGLVGCVHHVDNPTNSQNTIINQSRKFKHNK